MNPAAIQRQNKKGEIGETITWFVATVIIIVILLISIFIVSVGPFTHKEFKVCNERDLLVTKSLTSYLLTKDSGEEIFYKLASKDNLNDKKSKWADEKALGDFAYNLAEKIFSELYKNDYFAYNIFFSLPSKVKEISLTCEQGISEEIKLNENEFLILNLNKYK